MVSARSKKGTKITTLGDAVRRARQRRNISVAMVSYAITVPEQYLQALEDGDLTVFPAEVYAWGAYQKYADFLGLEKEKNRKAFLRALCKSRELVPLKVHTPRSWLAHVVTGHLLLMGIAAGIALAVGSYVLWQVQSFLGVPDVVVMEPKASVVSQERIILQGTVDDEAQLTINGEKTLMTPDGTFTTPLYLHPGVNRIRIEATNAAGRVQVVERDLLFSQS